MHGDLEDESSYVSYIQNPLQFPLNFSDLPGLERFAIVRKILFTKYKHWEYEHEIRIWGRSSPRTEEWSGPPSGGAERIMKN